MAGAILRTLLLLSLTACGGSDYTAVVPEAISVGTNYPVFVATVRMKDTNERFGPKRSTQMSFLEQTVSIPPNHTRGSVGRTSETPDPNKEFALAATKEFESTRDFQARIDQIMRENMDDVKEVTVFVHGYNTSQAQAVSRLAQLGYDLEIPGAMILFSWPSKGKLFGYAYDGDSVMFARDDLERLLRNLRSSGVRRIGLLAHSMGGQLAVETIRQIDIREPGWPARNLGSIVLVAPDLDIELFRRQLNGMSRVPDSFFVFASAKDQALNVSARLRGTHDRQRLGNIENIEDIADLPIQVVDTTAFDKSAVRGHFVAGTSSELIEMLVAARQIDGIFGGESRSLERLVRGRNVHLEEAEQVVLRPKNVVAQ